MRHTRRTAWLAAPLLLATLASFGAPRASDPASTRVASLRRLNLNGTTAAIPAALASLVDGRRPDAGAVNAASTASSVSGAAGATGRIAVPLGDVNGDAASDILDVRAAGATLNLQVISGKDGQTFWRAPSIIRPATVFAAVFPARINDGPTDFYLLEQHHKNAALSWTLHAVDGATGTDIWTTTGSLPEGVPPAPSIPPSLPPIAIPPSLPPIGIPPSLPPIAVPTIDPANPPGVPTIDPSTLPVPIPTPSGLPSIPPSIPPALPTPSGLPSPPSGVPTIDPAALPIPSIPPSLPADPTTLLPSIPPLPTIDPPVGSHRSARSRAAEGSPVPMAAYATGAKPVDVDGDGFADFPLTQHLALKLPTTSTLLLSTLATVSATDGQPIGYVTAAGLDAIPSALVAGDFTGLGGSGLLAVDEIAGQSGSIVTYRTHNAAGLPGFVSVEQVGLNTLGSYDATKDLTGDARADILSVRMPIVAGTGNTVVAVRSAPLGLVAWSRSVEDQATASVAGTLDAVDGADVVTQGIRVETGKIPTAVVYRGIAGSSGGDLYVTNVPVAGAGVIGDWFAKLSNDAGDLDNDSHIDLVHSVNAIPSGDAASGWSAAAVSAKAGRAIWSNTGALNPGAPVGGNLVDSPASDIVDVQESATKLSDSLVVRAISGADGKARWSTRVLIGGGSDRVRSLTVQASNPNAASDLVLAITQKSGTGTRSLIISMKGTTGQVMWIRTN